MEGGAISFYAVKKAYKKLDPSSMLAQGHLGPHTFSVAQQNVGYQENFKRADNVYLQH
jgi:hypothetical protein